MSITFLHQYIRGISNCNNCTRESTLIDTILHDLIKWCPIKGGRSKGKKVDIQHIRYMMGFIIQTWMEQQHQTHILVPIVGWVYFAAWSISFYGQIYENFKHRSVQGMNLDFVAMNLSGFLFYSIYTTYGYFINSDQTGQVDINDIFFAYHALFATLLCVAQACVFPKGANRVHAPTIVLLVIMWAFIMVYGTLTMETGTIKVESRLGVISFMGYFKIVITNLKYLPQMYWNYKRKSTKGWSIFNILLDMTGGILSFAQMLIEYLYGEDVDFNAVKVILGLAAVTYDIIFIIQHYCLYPESKQKQYQEVEGGNSP